jgi:hypothetical protein
MVTSSCGGTVETTRLNLSGKASAKGASITRAAKHPQEKKSWRQSIRNDRKLTITPLAAKHLS